MISLVTDAPVDAERLTAVRKAIADWREAGATKGDILRLLETVRGVIFTDATARALAIQELKEATGLPARDLNLPAIVDLIEDAEKTDRWERFNSGEDASLVDPTNYPKTVRQFLAARRDADGFTDLVRWQDGWWRAKGGHYEPFTEEGLLADLYPWLEEKSSVHDGRPLTLDRSFIGNLLGALKAAAHLSNPAAPSWLGTLIATHSPGELIPFRNGLLHLPTRTLLPPTRSFFNLNAVEFDYAASAPKPEGWLGFLKELWGEDVESIETLQELFGLALTTDTGFQKMFALIGPPRSGKGTIARVLQRCVGLSNVAAPTLNGLGQQFGLEGLIGKTLGLISDARLSKRTDVGAVVENLLRITGEDTLSVPRKHREDWTAKLSTRFILLSNEIPSFLDQSGALASRFVILSLSNSFLGKEDLTLEQKLVPELSGIVLWALEGLTRLKVRGYFRQPKGAAEEVELLQNLGSPIKLFVDDRCKLDAEATIDTKSLFDGWQDWNVAQGRDRDRSGTIQIFARNLRSAFPGITTPQVREGSEKKRAFRGIALLPAHLHKA